MWLNLEKEKHEKFPFAQIQGPIENIEILNISFIYFWL